MKWFNPEKEFSFVELTDGSGEAFLHIRQVEATGCSNLPAGTTLLIQVGPSQKGPQVKGIVRVDISTAAPEPTRRRPYATEAASSRFRQGSSPVTTPDTMGTVKWYDEVKGFGFIAVAGESKDLFVHASALERAGLSQLEQRQAVRVAIVDGRKGREVEAIKLA